MSSLELNVAQFQQSAPSLPKATKGKVDSASQDFESVFISQMLETAFDTVPTDGPMGGGLGENIFRSMMIQNIGKDMARQGGIGLAPNIRTELLRLQEGKHG
jgi:Rod binding domain-containing protein